MAEFSLTGELQERPAMPPLPKVEQPKPAAAAYDSGSMSVSDNDAGPSDASAGSDGSTGPGGESGADYAGGGRVQKHGTDTCCDQFPHTSKIRR